MLWFAQRAATTAVAVSIDEVVPAELPVPLDPVVFQRHFDALLAGVAQDGGADSYLAALAAKRQAVAGVRERARDSACGLDALETVPCLGYSSAETCRNVRPVTTTVPAVNVLCATLDAYETDNTSATASDLVADGSRQLHNFCNPAAPDRANDVDWIAVQVSAGIKYLFQSRPLHASAAPVIRLYESDGVTLITERAPAGFGQSVVLAYTPEQDGVLYMRIRHLNGSVLGSAVTYQVWVQEGYLTYFPIVEK